MSTDTIIVIAITAGIHVIGLGLLLAWMAAGYPMSKAQFATWLAKHGFPFRRRQPDAEQ